MKWLISKKEFAPGKRFKDFNKDDFKDADADGIVILKERNHLIDESFVIYDDDDRLNDAITDESKFHKWKTYTLKEKFKDRQKINYECFCGGYLAFYNRTLSSEGKDLTGKVIDRLLYLQWIEKDKETTINLFISNPPEGEGYRKSIQDFIKKNTNISLTADPPPADTQEDPDPPPGPPPPPDA
ncbi:MAG TPA: hypothetical protein VKA49_02420 [Flavitalea sp.]|nr:hypothetical protein [Flavitalea sp.]